MAPITLSMTRYRTGLASNLRMVSKAGHRRLPLPAVGLTGLGDLILGDGRSSDVPPVSRQFSTVVGPLRCCFPTAIGELTRGQMTKCAVWTLLVVIDAPRFDLLPGMIDRFEFVHVEAFIAQPTVEGFAQPIIRRLAGSREVKLHAVLPRPLIKRSRSKFGAMINGDRPGNDRAVTRDQARPRLHQ